MTGIKTALFVVGAALLHALATLVFFSAFLFLYVRIVLPRIPAAPVFPGFPLFFAAAFVLSAVLYRKAVKVFFNTRRTWRG
ncbi:MAG: hypothetical protein LBP69_06795 [Treponema sp.]|jgi:hypothetical protein|nr:hypothetical protein [Treponema sp.]